MGRLLSVPRIPVPVPADGLGKHRVVLRHVSAGAAAAGGCSQLTPKAPRSMPRAPLEKMALPEDGVIGAAVPDAHAGINRLGESNAVTGGAGAANGVVARARFALHGVEALPSAADAVPLGPDQVALDHIPGARCQEDAPGLLAEIRLPAPETAPPMVLLGARSR